MRTIKFRAWYTNKAHDKGIMSQPFTLFDLHNGLKFSSFADEVLLEQFTGLLDKNGKEIYEGDIVRYDARWHSGTKTEIAPVRYYCSKPGWIEQEAGWRPFLFFNGYHACNVEVIGNIHENPELLNPEGDA